jgi:hypothetical protein
MPTNASLRDDTATRGPSCASPYVLASTGASPSKISPSPAPTALVNQNRLLSSFADRSFACTSAVPMPIPLSDSRMAQALSGNAASPICSLVSTLTMTTVAVRSRTRAASVADPSHRKPRFT